jgi:hypothetical protein
MTPIRDYLNTFPSLYKAAKVTGVDAKTLARLHAKDALWCEFTGEVYIKSKTVLKPAS